jgi:lon-related putative ATP-dependent protease
MSENGRKARALELEADALRWQCDPMQLGFETTAELGEQPISIIGQERAMEALRLGLDLRAAGYNIFVAGEVGTGRSTAVRRQLEALAEGGEVPPDLCYVHCFGDPERPRLLSFPPGRGRVFRQAMDELVESLRKSIAELFESETFRTRRAELIEATKAGNKDKFRDFEKRIQEDGFVLAQVQTGPHVQMDLLRMVDGKPLDVDALEGLVEQGSLAQEEYQRIRERYSELSRQMESVTEQVVRLERELRRGLLRLDREVAAPLVESGVAELRRDFPGKKTEEWLDEVRADVLDHLERFRSAEEPPATGPKLEKVRARLRERMLPYAVNVVVDHSETEGRPILWEAQPTYRNLFGMIERVQISADEWHTDHTHIKAGSLLQASGGVLVLDAMDVLAEVGVWQSLKRTLRTRSVEIRPYDPLNILAGMALKPEAVPIDLKVVVIGTPHIHRLLHALDEDFQKIFKVKADFTLETRRSEAELQNYATFVQHLAKSEDLLPFHREAVAAVAEHGVRLAGDRDKLSTQFNQIADLLREASYWAHREDGGSRVEARHVRRALAARVHRLDRIEELMRERIADGTVLIDVEGERVGQVNGLVYLDTGDHTFGQPVKITATAAMGRAGIVDVEREARLSGPVHTKAVLILAGFLRARFAQDKPLALTASVCFEQSYGGVEGDSASLAELCALLSCLSGVPLAQSIAVTGSVSQKGEVQPVGGVSEKLEGYFDVCRALGLSGQGVLIPRRNVRNLQLRPDLVEAVRERRFHVFGVSTVEEALLVLTGRPAGVKEGPVWSPPDSVLARADARLRELAEGVVSFGTADLRLGV